MILDTNDDTWNDYFTEKEIIEINEHNRKSFEDLDPEIVEYLSSLVKVINC